MNSRIVAEVKPYVAPTSLDKTALFPSSLAWLVLACTATRTVPRGVQAFAGGSAGANIPMRPGWATFDRVQGRRKNDLFSPQARWGDDDARRVEHHSPCAGLPESVGSIAPLLLT